MLANALQLQHMNVFNNLKSGICRPVVMMELQPISISCDERVGAKCLIDMMEYTCISENPQILVN